MEQKILGVLGASKEKKYKFCINRIVDTLEVWGIFYSCENAWASISHDGNETLILFPEKEFAEYYMNTSKQCIGAPQKINLLEFIYEWKPALHDDGNIFLYGDDKNQNYTIEKVINDIYVEMNNY